MTTSWQRKVFLMVLPIATSLRSRLELMMQEMLVAKSAHKIHTRNSTETGRKADGRATVAPHEQMQFISVSFPHFNALPPSVGCCLATLPPCSTAALPCCCSPRPPPLHRGWEEPRSRVLPAVCKQRYCLFITAWKQVGTTQGRWGCGGRCALAKAWRAPLFLVPSAYWLWSGAYGLPIVQFFFCLCGCYSV